MPLKACKVLLCMWYNPKNIRKERKMLCIITQELVNDPAFGQKQSSVQLAESLDNLDDLRSLKSVMSHPCSKQG